MVVILYGSFRPRCVSAAVLGPDLGHDWALCEGTVTAVKEYFGCETTLSVEFFSRPAFELRIETGILLGCFHAAKKLIFTCSWLFHYYLLQEELLQSSWTCASED